MWWSICITAASSPAPACVNRVLSVTDFESLHYAAWRVEEGSNTTTLLEPQYPWDDDVHSEGTVLIDPWDGTYYAYYVSAPTTYPAGGQTMGRVVTVATSQDGKAWTRPLLDIVQWYVYLLETGTSGVQIECLMMQCVQCVSVHANTCPHQKYKNISLHRAPPHPPSHHSYHTPKK